MTTRSLPHVPCIICRDTADTIYSYDPMTLGWHLEHIMLSVDDLWPM
jgi:hypothetical protein